MSGTGNMQIVRLYRTIAKLMLATVINQTCLGTDRNFNIGLNSVTEMAKGVQKQARKQQRMRGLPSSLRQLTASAEQAKSRLLYNLSAAGYHRARVQTLSVYDKIIGGIVWALSITQPLADGRSWLFAEGPKTDLQKNEEVSQILEVIAITNCPHTLTIDHLINLNFEVLDKVVFWICGRFTETFGGGYVRFLDSLRTYTNDNEASIEFLASLRSNDKMKSEESIRINLFDASILRDTKATGRMILAEYINYHKVGSRIYPKFCGGQEEGVAQPPEVSFEAYESARGDLEKQAANFIGAFNNNTSKAQFKYFASLIDKFEVARTIQVAEERFVVEGRKYYEDHKLHNELVDTYKSLLTKYLAIKATDTPTLLQAVQMTIERIEKMQGALEDDHKRSMVMEKWLKFDKQIPRKTDIEEKLTACLDLMSTLQKYSNELMEIRQKGNDCQVETDQKDVDVDEGRFGSKYDDMRPGCSFWDCEESEGNAVEESDPNDSDDDEESQCANPHDLNDLDDDLARVFTPLSEKIQEHIEISPAASKKDAELLDAFINYILDVHVFVNDWCVKARLMYHKRLNVKNMIEELKLKNKKAQCDVSEKELGSKLTEMLEQANNELSQWEKDSLSFQESSSQNSVADV